MKIFGDYREWEREEGTNLQVDLFLAKQQLELL
jgi:hypothetical protein